MSPDQPTDARESTPGQKILPFQVPRSARLTRPTPRALFSRQKSAKASQLDKLIFSVCSHHIEPRRTLHTWSAAAINYAFYTHLTKYYSNSAEHTFLLVTINGQASARHWQETRHSTWPNVIPARQKCVNNFFFFLTLHVINTCKGSHRPGNCCCYPTLTYRTIIYLFNRLLTKYFIYHLFAIDDTASIIS